jgi:hypothetical protein
MFLVMRKMRDLALFKRQRIYKTKERETARETERERETESGGRCGKEGERERGVLYHPIISVRREEEREEGENNRLVAQ